MVSWRCRDGQDGVRDRVQGEVPELIDEMQKDGVPVVVTKRGKVVAKLTPKTGDTPPLKPVFGMLKSDRYRFDWNPSEPAIDPDDWEALR
jgi:antitoxin (DNA-binding transcriptional repressor) of toxin-antitoxin stability system